MITSAFEFISLAEKSFVTTPWTNKSFTQIRRLIPGRTLKRAESEEAVNR